MHFKEFDKEAMRLWSEIKQARSNRDRAMESRLAYELEMLLEKYETEKATTL